MSGEDWFIVAVVVLAAPCMCYLTLWAIGAVQ